MVTDPGIYTSDQKTLTGISTILITHKHQDHMDVDSLKAILERNPDAEVVSNSETQALLEKEGIKVRVVQDKEVFTAVEFEVQCFETDHAPIYPSIEVPRNTGFLINRKFYMPGDALFAPPVRPKALGIPFGAPWATIGDLLEYGITVKPDVCFPSHDGILSTLGPFESVPKSVFGPFGIAYVPMRPGDQLHIS